MTHSKWHPIVDGALADDLRSIAVEIGDALAALAPSITDPSLSSGNAGLALFFTELGAATDDDRWLDHATSCIDSAIDAAPTSPMPDSLYAGTVGVGYAVDALAGRLFAVDPDDDESDVDELVAYVLSLSPWPAHYDVVNGLSGLGAYVLRRLPRPSAARSLHGLVERFAEVSEESSDGVTWRTRPATLPPTPITRARAEAFPDGYFDVGLAHGVAGVMVVLAAALAAGEMDAKPLLEGALAWLRAHRIAESGDGSYPLMFPPGVKPARGGRSAWCYGDPGVAVALAATGLALGDAAAVDEARDIAVAAAGKPPVDAGIADAGLCHGSAGLAHVCARLGFALDDERLLESSRQWLEYTVRHRRPGEDIAGFPSLQMKRDGSGRELAAVPGVLEGAAGVGLALLGALSSVPPAWDGFLLLDRIDPWGDDR